MNKTMKNLKTLVQGFIFVGLMLSLASAAMAEGLEGVYRQQVNKPIAEVYDKVYESLEESRFYVVFEPNIGKNLAGFAEKWGDEYNQNNLSALRSMVFCNGWYANKVSNIDPNMLGFCPLHISLFERDGKTTVLFNRPGVIAKNSPAKAVFVEIETAVIEAIQKGLQ